MNYKQIETYIVYHSDAIIRSGKIDDIKEDLNERRSVLDYIMSRFIEDFDIDSSINNPITRFYNAHCAEYELINRLFRVMDSYAK